MGTSLSSAAIVEDGKAVPLRVGTAASLLIGDSYCLPSTVFIEESGEILLGQAADNSRMKNPVRYRKEFKRDLGTSEPYRIADMELFPEDLYREFLKYFKAAAEERLGGSVERAVVTHPANFAGYKKELIQKAGLMAGFSKLDLIDEPTAAAIYYSSKEKIEVGEKLLVYDLGGGTFDVSLIEKEEDGFKPLAVPLGIERCGGVDFQRKIYEDIIATFNKDIVPVLSAGGIVAKQFAFMIETESTRIKHQLSTALKAEAVINLPGTFQFKTYEITRERFQELIREDIEATCKKIEDIVKNADLQMQQIDKVLLVGGSSRIPYIEEAIKKVTGKSVSKDADTELIVALGAALYAGKESLNKEKKNSTSQKKENKIENKQVTVENKLENKQTNKENKVEKKQNIEEKLPPEKPEMPPQKPVNPLQIPERYKGHFKKSSYTSSQVVAMEIGSSFSKAACIFNGQPIVITNSNGEKQIPTAISFDGNRYFVGAEAKQMINQPNTSSYLDVNNLIRLQRKINIDGIQYQPELLYAFIIQKLKEDAEAFLKKKVAEVVLVVPMYFSYNMKKYIKYAAKLAEVEVLMVMDSSTAAAANYSYRNSYIGGTFLLCNVGSETTEFSVYEAVSGKVTASSKLGFILNGGNDYTRSIMEHVVNECRKINGIDILSQPTARESLFTASEMVKREFMRSFNTGMNIAGLVNPSFRLKAPVINLHKSDYAVMTSGVTNKIAASCDIKGMLGSRISKTVLTGEGAYTPLVRERINSLTRKEVVIAENPEVSAVLGGVIQGGIMTGDIDSFNVVHSLNRSIGVRTIDGKNNIIIPKSSPLPAYAAQVLTAGTHFYVSEGIVIAEGENVNGQEVEILGQIELYSLGAQGSSALQVEVKIDVDSDGDIKVRIRDIKSSKEICKVL